MYVSTYLAKSHVCTVQTSPRCDSNVTIGLNRLYVFKYVSMYIHICQRRLSSQCRHHKGAMILTGCQEDGIYIDYMYYIYISTVYVCKYIQVWWNLSSVQCRHHQGAMMIQMYIMYNIYLYIIQRVHPICIYIMYVCIYISGEIPCLHSADITKVR